MKYGLSEAQLQEIITFIGQYPEVEAAVLFGSRAIDTYKEASDVDIALKGARVTHGLAAKMKFDIEEDSLLPFFFDFVAYPLITNEALKTHIDTKGVVIFRRGRAGEWREFRLIEIAEILDEKRIPLSKMEREKRRGKYSYYGASGVIDSVDSYLFDGQYVLISEDGENLKTRQTPIAFIASGQFWVNNHAHIVKGKKDFLNKLIVYCLSITNLHPFLTGAVQPKLNQENLRTIPFFLPVDENEQRAIAGVLSSLDDKIDLLYRQNKMLEAMAETLFRQWFIEEADAGWEETTLSQHIDVFRGLSYKGSGLNAIGMGIPMHNLNSVHEGGGYKLEGIKYYNGEYKERHLVSPGEIIVTNTEQGHAFKLIGFPAIVPNIFGNQGIFSQHIYRLAIKKESYLSNEFIYYLLIESSIREQIISATNGSTVNMLAIDGLQRPEFKLPSKELTIKFSRLVSNYWKKQNVNNSQIRTLEKLRDSLLPKLMSGEVRVSVLT